ncbi:hypothetical protein VTK56DRAFT_1254 [Thermocarpiscus australiensis]
MNRVVGIGQFRLDERQNKGQFYADVICVARDGGWALNQWTSENVVIESVPEAVLNKPAGISGSCERRKIGHNLASSHKHGRLLL